MAYDPGLSTATDRIRFAVQDIDDAAPLLATATYTALLARYTATDAATAEDRATVAAAEALLVKFAQSPDSVEVTGAVKVAWKYRLEAWRELANGLRLALGLPLVGTGADSAMRVGRLTRGGVATSEFGG